MLTIDPFSLKAGCILAEKFRQPAHIEIFLTFSALRIFHTRHFLHSVFSTFLIFHTPDFPHSSYSTEPLLTRLTYKTDQSAIGWALLPLNRALNIRGTNEAVVTVSKRHSESTYLAKSAAVQCNRYNGARVTKNWKEFKTTGKTPPIFKLL